MAVRNHIFIDSDNLLTVSALTDLATDVKVDSATVTASVTEENPLNPDKNSDATDEGDGKVGIPCGGHGLVGGTDHIFIVGTEHYNGEYLVDGSSTTDKIIITATFVDETFTGNGHIYKCLIDGYQISMAAEGGSTGNYSCVLSEALKLIPSLYYNVFIDITDGSSDALIKKRVQAVFSGG